MKGDLLYCRFAYTVLGEIVEVDNLDTLKLKLTAKPMKDFTVQVNGEEKRIADVMWLEPACKDHLDNNNEIFIRVKWKKYKENPKDGIWEAGMVSVPMVAYKLSEPSTYKRVRELFG